MYEFKSPAKVNLGLEVIGQRSDGYHLIDTVFAQINLYDHLYVKKTNRNSIRITSNKDIPLNHENLVWKALKKLNIEQGYNIHIEKNIPIGGGLGGGSSNAATILRNARYFVENVNEFDLDRLARELGADVLYCFKGGIMRGKGIGDDLRPIRSILFPKIAILPQKVNASTKFIFSKYKRFNRNFAGNMDLVENALIKGNMELFISNLDNSLEAPFLNLFPESSQMVENLRDTGLNVQISGSGSTFYVVLTNDNDIIKLKKNYESEIIVCDLLSNHE